MSLVDFILTYKGCPKFPSAACFGPSEQWFLMGLPLSQYSSIILLALFFTIIVSAISCLIKRKDLNAKKVIKIVIISFIVTFILIYLFLISMQMNAVY